MKNKNRNSDRVIRSGSWFSVAEYCRATLRLGALPALRYHTCGFRIVISKGTKNEEQK
jgi:formylglycine-generating enzyme required for sulfatase activity